MVWFEPWCKAISGRCKPIAIATGRYSSNPNLERPLIRLDLCPSWQHLCASTSVVGCGRSSIIKPGRRLRWNESLLKTNPPYRATGYRQ